MKILVTGGAGFIGSEFVRQAVARGYEPVVLDKLTYAGDPERIKGVKAKFYRADIADANAVGEILERERPASVVHWAAESHVDRSIRDASPFIESNVKGTHVLLEAARRMGTERFVNVSTDEVYGELADEGMFYETTSLNPSSPYSASKASADMLGRAYHRTYGLPVVTVRPSNNYGPWQYPEKLIPVVIMKALQGEKVPVYGRGLNVREWLHVTDCAKGVFAVLEKGKDGEVYNIGSGREMRNIEVVKAVLAVLERPEDLIEFVPDRPGHDYRYRLSVEKMDKELGWKAETPLPEGVESTVKWYVDNMEWAKGKISR